MLSEGGDKEAKRYALVSRVIRKVMAQRKKAEEDAAAAEKAVLQVRLRWLFKGKVCEVSVFASRGRSDV